MVKMSVTSTILTVLCATLFTAESAVFAPWLNQKHGPLYEGIRLLIADERFNAELVWNETDYHINETTQILQNLLDDMHHYGDVIDERLGVLGALDRPAELQLCLKQYEREVARFNRELLHKHNVCMETLETGKFYLENELNEEIEFIQNAAHEVGNIADMCNIVSLKRNGTANQQGVTLCVVSRLGVIDQRLFRSAQFCLDVVSNISVNDDSDSGADSCRSFNELRQQFDTVYNEIMYCVNPAV